MGVLNTPPPIPIGADKKPDKKADSNKVVKEKKIIPKTESKKPAEKKIEKEKK